LLLWTTDGELLHRLTHPRYAVHRTYHVALARPFADPPPELTLEDGHQPRIELLRRCDTLTMHPALPIPPDAMAWAEITLTTGRFHEVRRIFAALGSHVVGLCRIAFGPVLLPPDLPTGGFVRVDLHEVFHGLSPKSPPRDEAG
jgi:16S rRNA pseudouridine516 synthase